MFRMIGHGIVKRRDRGADAKIDSVDLSSMSVLKGNNVRGRIL